MDQTDLTAKVSALRARGLTPKEIAKTLGVRRAAVEPFIHALAQARAASDPNEPALFGCWVSPGWSHGLAWEGHPDWRDDNGGEADGVPRLVGIAVAREHRTGKVSVCGYLVDAQCLGVKNVVGPRVMDRQKLRDFLHVYFTVFPGEPQSAPLDLAQHLVFGALDYAQRLGFAPHHEFPLVQEHLGAWDGPGAIEFGYHGKPFFVRGPDDDPAYVIRTLERSVGPGNFDFILMGA
jgi:hypothetical protein